MGNKMRKSLYTRILTSQIARFYFVLSFLLANRTQSLSKVFTCFLLMRSLTVLIKSAKIFHDVDSCIFVLLMFLIST